MTGIEALKFFKNINKKQNNGNGDIMLEMYIQAIEKELMALKIVKEKNVIISLLVISPSLQFYNRYKIKKHRLTEKEFELLQEVFCNE